LLLVNTAASAPASRSAPVLPPAEQPSISGNLADFRSPWIDRSRHQ
jgi:hypothetical protein